MTGGEAVARMLRAHGVDHGFGIGGYQALPYYDAIRRLGGIRHVLVRDEKHGAFAADAYARIAGRPAVADATLGPGTTNLISGAAESYGAGVPVVLLASEVNQAISGRAATQESDQFSMLRPTSKLAQRVDRVERIPELVRKALNASTSGRPGPVLLDIPEDVFHAEHDFDDRDLWVDPAAGHLGARRALPDPVLVSEAAALLWRARRPLILAGGGVHLSLAYEALARAADIIGVPVATTISGKGVIAETHPLAVGVFGRYSRIANDLIKSSDLLIVVGCKLGEIATGRWTLIPDDVPMVHVDIDPLEIGKVYRPAVGIWSDAAVFLDALTLESAASGEVMFNRRRDQLAEIAAAKARYLKQSAAAATSDERPIHLARVLSDLQAVAPDDTVLVAEGGFATHWSALWFDTKRAGRTYIANRGHAAIGYGVAGALGAKLATPNSPVVALCGDGGFGMGIGELETLIREKTPVVLLVVNNLTLGYVKALQNGLYGGRFQSVDFVDVDYAAVARAFGCRGERIADPDRVRPAIAEAIESDTVTVLDVLVTTDPARMLPGVDARAVRGT